MSARVDVLEVLYSRIGRFDAEGRFREDAEIIEARAAVAELIEEAERVCGGTGDIKDLRAALERVGGAS